MSQDREQPNMSPIHSSEIGSDMKAQQLIKHAAEAAKRDLSPSGWAPPAPCSQAHCHGVTNGSEDGASPVPVEHVDAPRQRRTGRHSPREGGRVIDTAPERHAVGTRQAYVESGEVWYVVSRQVKTVDIQPECVSISVSKERRRRVTMNDWLGDAWREARSRHDGAPA